MKEALVEGIGTFFLVLVIGLMLLPPGAGVLAPVAIGAVLTAMVYAGGHISGAHYNPAVTLAVWLRGGLEAARVPRYMGAQTVGAILAATVVRICKLDSVVLPGNPDPTAALLVELVFTFALAFVVLNVATSKKTAGNSYYGIAIGFTVMAAAYAAGNISGGAFNPAVAIGITLLGLSSVNNFWIFVVANLVGGALAAVVFRAVNPHEK